MNPLVSAIITTHNREAKIVQRAIDSVLKQTYKNIEIILVNDSTVLYEQRSMVEELQVRYPQIIYLDLERNHGVSVARNAGLTAAKGEFVAYLDDDDEWLPEKIERQIELFSAPEVALVYCNRIIVDERNNTVHLYKGNYFRGKVYEKLLLDNFIGSTSFPLIRKEVLTELRGFDEDMQASEDADAWIRIAEKYEVEYVEQPLVRYHFHEGEQITKNPNKRIQGLECLLKKNAQFVESHPVVFWKRTIVIAPFYAMCGKRKEAFALWRRAIKKYPFKLYENAKYLYRIIVELRKYRQRTK